MRTAMKMIDSPLYRFAVFRLSHGRSGYLVILHHLIADGWSMKLLTAFLTAAYLEETGMAPRGTAPVERITYTDCVDWEQEADVTGVRDSDRLFWTAMLRSCGEGTPRSYPPRIEAEKTNAAASGENRGRHTILPATEGHWAERLVCGGVYAVSV